MKLLEPKLTNQTRDTLLKAKKQSESLGLQHIYIKTSLSATARTIHFENVDLIEFQNELEPGYSLQDALNALSDKQGNIVKTTYPDMTIYLDILISIVDGILDGNIDYLSKCLSNHIGRHLVASYYNSTLTVGALSIYARYTTAYCLPDNFIMDKNTDAHLLEFKYTHRDLQCIDQIFVYDSAIVVNQIVGSMNMINILYRIEGRPLSVDDVYYDLDSVSYNFPTISESRGFTSLSIDRREQPLMVTNLNLKSQLSNTRLTEQEVDKIMLNILIPQGYADFKKKEYNNA